jgi:hypothetical protein
MWAGAAYGLEGPSIESRCGRDIPHPSRPTLVPISLLHNRYRVIPRVRRPGRAVDHPPPTSARLKKQYSYTSPPLLGLRGLF